MMRSKKTNELIDAEIGQICMNITHDQYRLNEVLHFLISQREALVELCQKQEELITSLQKDLVPTPKSVKMLSREKTKLASLLENI